MNDFEVVKHFLQRLWEFPVIKILTGFFIWMLQQFWGHTFRAAYGAVIALWIVDTITGYYHARTNPEITPESRRMYHGLVKLTIYLVLLGVGYQCSNVEFAAFIQGLIEGSIILTEGYSVLENLQKIAKLKGEEIPLISSIMKAIQGKIGGDPNNG